MNPLILQDKRHSQRIPVALDIIGQLEDRRISMCSETISLDGIFLSAREFVRPRALFSARVWISSDEEPIQAYLNSCFIESRWTGYGIGVHISGITAADRTRWESFYRCCAASGAKLLRQIAQAERTAWTRRVLVVDGALSPLAVQALRKQGLQVSHAQSVGDAIAFLDREPIDAVISDLYRPGLDGLALCCYVNRERLPTRTVLITSSATPREFLLGLYTGATHVIAKPSSNETFAARILEIVKQPLPAGRVLPARDPSVWDSAVTASPRLSEEIAAPIAASVVSARRDAYLAA